MGSLQSKIAIWNMALDHLKEAPLSSTTDEDAFCKWLQRNYDQTRDYVLGRYIWKFAQARAAIAAESAAPAFGWTKQFVMPSDMIRLIPLTLNGAWMGTPIAYELEGNANGDQVVLCNWDAGALNIRYIRRITNEGKFTNDFCEVLAIRLARRMAHWATGKNSLVQTLDAMMKETMEEVKQTEAFQTLGGQYYDDDIASSREQVF